MAHQLALRRMRVRLERAEQLSPEVAGEAALVILPVEEIAAHRQLLSEYGGRLAAELPVLLPPGAEEGLGKTLADLREAGLEKALCPGPGQLLLAKAAGLRPYGDYGLNVLNSCALRACRDLGAEDMTLSFETNLPLMTFRACPVQGPKGCGRCTGQAALTDRLGKSFPVVCRGRQYSQLLNTVPLYLGDKRQLLEGFSHATLRFTIEDPGGRPLPGGADQRPVPAGAEIIQGVSQGRAEMTGVENALGKSSGWGAGGNALGQYLRRHFLPGAAGIRAKPVQSIQNLRGEKQNQHTLFFIFHLSQPPFFLAM